MGMWYAILGAALAVAVFMWQFYKVSLHAYIGYIVANNVKQPDKSELRQWIHWAVTHMLSGGRS